MQRSMKRFPCTKREKGAAAVQCTKPTGDKPVVMLAPMAETSQWAGVSCVNHEKKKNPKQRKACGNAHCFAPLHVPKVF